MSAQLKHGWSFRSHSALALVIAAGVFAAPGQRLEARDAQPPSSSGGEPRVDRSSAQQWKDQGWPRRFESGSNELRVHQPQVDEWPDFDRIKFRAAISVGPKFMESEATYGILVMSAATRVAFEERVVELSDRRIESIEFPGVPEDEAAALRRIVEEAAPPQRTMTVSLERIIAQLNTDNTHLRTTSVNLDPPTIYSSESPAVMVIFMGKPRFKQVEGSTLLAAANTNWDLFLDPATGNHYLLMDGSWLMTADLMSGAWAPAGTLPAAFAKLPEGERWADARAAVPGKPAPTPLPRIIVSPEPAELIVTEGAPEMELIPGTKLMTVTNTENDLFYKMDDREFYLLAAGRWFRAPALTGPWVAASQSLPDDFRNIPEDSEQGDVLASVPGTMQAKEAAILASIPNKAVVNTSEVKITVEYSGNPDFRPIEGTTVKYAYNTPYNVFLVGGRYYCCHNAIWFESDSPTGVWTVCRFVPAEIYTIPPTSPKYNVTYVQVYESTPTTVTTGYTAGYTGAQVAATGAVMFGLGVLVGIALDNDDDYYVYHYHSGFYSYGCGVSHYHYYGGYNGGFVTTARRYGPYGGAGGFAAYNPATGGWARGGYVYGPGGVAAGRAGYNPNTGLAGYRAGAVTPYGSWSRGAVTNGDDWVRGGQVNTAAGSIRGVQGSGGAGAIQAEGRWGNGVTVAQTRGGDVYAGKDGNVYKKTDDGWEQQTRPEPKQTTRERPTTQPAQTNAGAQARTRPSAEQSSYLQQQSAARDRGSAKAQRSEAPQRSRPAPSGGRRGGGRR